MTDLEALTQVCANFICMGGNTDNPVCLVLVPEEVIIHLKSILERLDEKDIPNIDDLLVV